MNSGKSFDTTWTKQELKQLKKLKKNREDLAAQVAIMPQQKRRAILAEGRASTAQLRRIYS